MKCALCTQIVKDDASSIKSHIELCLGKTPNQLMQEWFHEVIEKSRRDHTTKIDSKPLKHKKPHKSSTHYKSSPYHDFGLFHSTNDHTANFNVEDWHIR